jgi:predicted Zn-dependent protease
VRLSILALVWLAGAVAAQVPPTSREQALGRLLAAEIERRERLVEDPAVLDYVTAVAQKLSRLCGVSQVSVRVVQSEAANGSAAPEGVLFLNTGLLKALETEAELAGVLAHLMTRTQSAPGADVFAPGQPVVSPAGAEVAAQAAVTTADQRAMQCMDKAGYDPVGLIAILRRLPAIPVDRMENVAEVIMTLEPSSAFLVTTRQFAEVRQHVSAIAPPSLRN